MRFAHPPAGARFADNFFADTYPLVLCYGLFVLSVVFFGLLQEQDAPLSYRGAAAIFILNIIHHAQLIFRFVVAVCFGFIPAYYMTQMGGVKMEYQFWAHGLYLLYGVWLMQWIVRSIINRLTRFKQ